MIIEDKSKKVAVRGRTKGEVFYRLPDSHNIRTFNFGETQMIPFEEIERLFYSPGGEYMIRNSLIVNADALETLGIDVQPEYYYTEKQIEDLLSSGTLDQLEDTLNFAPDGVIELIKQIAVKTKLFDTRKRKLILEKTGFNIDGALEIKKVLEEVNTEEEEAKDVPKRKAAPLDTSTSSTPERKAPAPSKYKVIS